MQNDELQANVSQLLTTATFEEGGDWLTVNVGADELLPLASQLRDDQALTFNYLFCLTCIDWKTHLTMVYHLTSTQYRHSLVLKVKLDRDKPAVESLAFVWRTAEFHEREVYELFGVDFIHHPDLRLLILPDGWEGKNPLRKDFEDPINMIRL